MKPGNGKQELYCGLEVDDLGDLSLEENIQNALDDGFSFAVYPIAKESREKEVAEHIASNKNEKLTGLSLDTTNLERTDLDHTLGASVSSWLKLDVSKEDDAISKIHEQEMLHELMLTQHLGLPVVTLPKIDDNRFINYARIVNSFLMGHTTSQYWLRTPVTLLDADGKNCAWEKWNTFRTLCNFSNKLFVALELSEDLPDEAQQDCWLGENVKGVFIPCDIFLTNAKGFPVLSRGHQMYMKKLLKFPIRFVLTGKPRHKEGIAPYFKYIKYLHHQMPQPAPLDDFSNGYEDYLQAPLQPLMDHLESGTYEVFEMDPIKYREYEEAVFQALTDNKSTEQIVIYVVGAGRGPLVSCSLRAAANAKKDVKVYALEKNPNAIITLQRKNRDEWKGKVTVISADMRFWKPDQKADILVSELLGSFSDNELSPECLDGAQSFLKEDGISIPASYTSFIAPLMAPKLHSDIETTPKANKCVKLITNYETPYVVRMRTVSLLSKPRPLFVFEHPNRDEIIDNSRYGSETFEIQENTLLHGIAGYFETVLYKNVTLSINPETHSPDMLSWFPIYFPIKDPMEVRKGDKVTIHFWRKVDEHKVWYEWCISSPNTTPIHNANARSYFIGL